MKGILADKNVEGHVTALVRILQEPTWREFWLHLNLSVFTFEDLGLAASAPDSLLWHACQQEGILLITSNRNAAGSDSLQETIRTRNRVDSLPVFTLADAERVVNDRGYAERVAEALLEYLFRIDDLRGTGRLYLP
jgi:hypothetical protein